MCFVIALNSTIEKKNDICHTLKKKTIFVTHIGKMALETFSGMQSKNDRHF